MTHQIIDRATGKSWRDEVRPEHKHEKEVEKQLAELNKNVEKVANMLGWICLALVVGLIFF